MLDRGAGVIARASMTPEAEANDRASIREALNAAVLEQGGTALDAVETGIKLIEDDPLCHAGRGAVLAADGTNQPDAAIMNSAMRLAAHRIAGCRGAGALRKGSRLHVRDSLLDRRKRY